MTLKIIAERVRLRLDSDGAARVAGTRVTLDTVVFAFKEGATAEEIARQYLSVPLSDVYSVLGYYLHSRDEVEEYLKARSGERERIRAENEARFDHAGIRDRLIERSHRLDTLVSPAN